MVMKDPTLMTSDERKAALDKIKEANRAANAWSNRIKALTDSEIRHELRTRIKELTQKEKRLMCCTLGARAASVKLRRDKDGGSSKGVLVKFSPREHADLMQYARRDGMSMAAFVRMAVENEMNAIDDEEDGK